MKPQLTDEKLAMIIKLALEYNASIIAQASFIYNRPLKERDLIRAYEEIRNTSKRYGKQLEIIINGEDPDNLKRSES